MYKDGVRTQITRICANTCEFDMEKIIYPELSYQIINTAFKVYNAIGRDHKELYFHRAMEIDFRNKGLSFEREKEVSVVFEGCCVGTYYLDFVVDNKIIVELKVGDYPRQRHMKQVLEYLNAMKLKLAILIYFTRNGVVSERIVNSKL